jgi:hypothetical protein
MNIGLKKERNIHKYGIEADAIILRNEIRGCRSERFKCSYVTYIDVDGVKHEAIINKYPDLPIDSKIKIKYLPDDYKHVVFISQKLDQKERM